MGSGDHPRSRGVYVTDYWNGRSEHGSSPLARGLPLAHDLKAIHLGIIPARAGFTRCTTPHSGTCPDHPRSRGVYAEYIVGDVWREGSSPLARGLLTRLKTDLSSFRIIPARAGFTVPPTAPHGRSRDHPRSRGVYELEQYHALPEQGSSPLARGLPTGWTWGLFNGRIIPARAGFTAPVVPTTGAAPDHPRSRGVYPPAHNKVPLANGSSPLARGLR